MNSDDSNHSFEAKFNGSLATAELQGEQSSLIVMKASLEGNVSLPAWVAPDFYFVPMQAISADTQGALSETRTRGFGINARCSVLDATHPRFQLHLNFSIDLSGLISLSESQTKDGITTYRIGYVRHGREVVIGKPIKDKDPRALQIVARTYLNINGTDPLAGTDKWQIVMVWARATDSTDTNKIDHRAMICQPDLITAEFLVNTTSGIVKDYRQITSTETTLEPYTSSFINSTFLRHSALQVLGVDPLLLATDHRNPKGDWHTQDETAGWMNHFIMLKAKSRELIDPIVPLPSDISRYVPVVEDIIRRSVSIHLGLNPEMLAPAPPATTLVEGRTFHEEERVFMVESSFFIVITILSLNIVTAVIYYIRAPKRILPRMPINIGVLIGAVIFRSQC